MGVPCFNCLGKEGRNPAVADLIGWLGVRMVCPYHTSYHCPREAGPS